MQTLSPFVRAYLACALWSSTNADTGEHFDRDYDIDDFAPEALEQVKRDCEQFQTANAKWLETAYELYAPSPLHGSPEARAGYDFWLTRNHHGAGFWDRGLGDVGDWLTEAAHKFCEVDVYAYEGQLYFFPS